MRRSKDWLDQAIGDLEHARASIELGHFEWSCFAAQQAAEKAAKAVFEDMGAVAWGHSAADLLQELTQHHAVANELMEGAYELDKAYIPARYPNAHPSGSPRQRFTHDEAARLVKHAQRIVDFCAGLLSPAE
jgi:HEPN domain-containing protein